MISEYHARFRRGFYNSASALATHWLPRVGFPVFNRYYADAKTASVHLLAFFVGSDCSKLFSLFSLRLRRVPARPWVLVAGLTHRRLASSRQEALPASRESP